MRNKNKEQLKSTNKNSSRELVKRYSSGSVGLQRGRFVTADEKDTRRKRVLEMKFS